MSEDYRPVPDDDIEPTPPKLKVKGSKLTKTLGVGAAVGIGSAAIVAAALFVGRNKTKG